MTTLADLMRDGSLEGYRRYTPTGIGADIDREVAEGARCDACGGSCVYRGFRDGDSYRAFACCVRCGNAAEF